jgi:O-antigen/teichoic acid export membrane protein
MKERISIVKNAAVSSVGTYAEYALGLVTSVFIARGLGPNEFGRYSFAIWLCGWMLVASNNALTMSSIKFLAESRGRGDPSEPARIGGYLLRLQRMSTTVVVVGFLIAVMIFRPSDWSGSSIWIVPLIAIAVVTRAGFAMRVALAKGFERFGPEAIAVIVVGCATLGMVAFEKGRSHEFGAFVAIYAIGSISLDVLIRIIIRRQGIVTRSGPIDAALLGRIKRHLFSTGVMIVLLSMSARTIETLLLKATSTAAAVGFFAISATLAKGAVDVLASGLSATLLPAMARSHGRAVNLRSTILPDSIRYFAFLGFALAGGGYLLAAAIVHLLYGARFDAAIPAAEISLLVAGCALLTAPINAYQTTSDLQVDRIRIAAITLAVNLIAGVMLIPHWGLNGALATLAVSRAAYLIAAIAFLKWRESISFPTASVTLMLLAATIAFFGAQAMGSLLRAAFATVIEAVAFSLLYVGLTIAFRCWNRSDYQLAERLTSMLHAPSGVRVVICALERRYSGDSRA